MNCVLPHFLMMGMSYHISWWSACLTTLPDDQHCLLYFWMISVSCHISWWLTCFVTFPDDQCVGHISLAFSFSACCHPVSSKYRNMTSDASSQCKLALELDTDAHTDAHIHICSHWYTYTDAHTDTHIHMHTLIHTYTNAHWYTHTQMHTERDVFFHQPFAFKISLSCVPVSVVAVWLSSLSGVFPCWLVLSNI